MTIFRPCMHNAFVVHVLGFSLLPAPQPWKRSTLSGNTIMICYLFQSSMFWTSVTRFLELICVTCNWNSLLYFCSVMGALVLALLKTTWYKYFIINMPLRVGYFDLFLTNLETHYFSICILLWVMNALFVILLYS